MKAIKLVAGGIGLIASMSTFGFGYDGVSNPIAGTSGIERHAFVNFGDPAGCLNPAFCAGADSDNSESQIQLTVTNTSTCTLPTGPCIAANVVDTYQGTGGAATLGVAPTVDSFQIHSPECDQPTNTNCGRDLPLVTALAGWDFITDATGKITSGYLYGDSGFGSPAGTVGVFILEADGTKELRTYRGGSSQLILACAIDINADPSTCWTDDPGTPLDGPAGASSFAYITVPMVEGSLNKAVPVPAFAAAALGLGLIAITVLTGRRRQIK